MRLHLDRFMGMMPRAEPNILPPGYAQIAENCRLDTGGLAPIRESGVVTTLATPAEAIVLHEGIWRGYPTHVDHARGPIAKERLYLTRDDGDPLIYVGTTGTYDLKLEAPTVAPTAENSQTIVTGEDGEPNPPLEQVRYAYTYVTILDEETAPSPLSPILLTQGTLTVNVGGMENPGAGRGIDRIRIYRSQTSLTGSTTLHFVKETSVVNSTVIHDPVAEPISNPITTLAFAPVPDGMRGITSMPNGMMAGFTGQTLHFCEPYQPHAWPVNYDLSTDYPIVGLVSLGSTLVVLTTGTPYIAQGTTPSSVVMAQLEENLPCMSPGSIVDLGTSAAYASHRGLVAVTPGGTNLVTRQMFTREQWRGLDPASFRAAQIDGRYVFAHGPSDARAFGIIDLTGDQPFYKTADIVAKDIAYDIATGDVFTLGDDGVSVGRFDDLSEPHLTLTWRSGRMQFDYDQMFGAGIIKVRPLGAGPAQATLRLYADGVLIHTETSINQTFRLPAVRAVEWEMELETPDKITSVTIAGGASELIA